MLDLGSLREATQLWIVVDSSEQDTRQLCEQLAACNSARDAMLTGELSVDDFLDVLAENDVDIDSYEETTERNMEALVHGQSSNAD
jgi:hypothetical protein